MDTLHQPPVSDETLPARIAKFREAVDEAAQWYGLPPEPWAA